MIAHISYVKGLVFYGSPPHALVILAEFGSPVFACRFTCFQRLLNYLVFDHT